MQTDDLIRALAADRTQPRLRPTAALALALTAGLPVSFAMFMLLLGPREDIAIVARDPRFELKFAITLALAAAAMALSLRIARPGAPRRPIAIFLAAGPLLLAAGIAVELATVPAAQWAPRLVGSNALVCLTYIPLLSLPLLPAVLIALRTGAPTDARLAGATAGLVAAALAATLYAAHCTDDSPLFVATWYILAILIIGAIGAFVGGRALRW